MRACAFCILHFAFGVQELAVVVTRRVVEFTEKHPPRSPTKSEDGKEDDDGDNSDDDDDDDDDESSGAAALAALKTMFDMHPKVEAALKANDFSDPSEKLQQTLSSIIGNLEVSEQQLFLFFFLCVCVWVGGDV